MGKRFVRLQAIAVVALSAVLAFPGVCAKPSSSKSVAFADGAAQTQASATAKGAIKKVHVHVKRRVPTSENLARYATFTSKPRYHFVCKCGKQFKATYEYGHPLTAHLSDLVARYEDSPTGGIAFTGSSLFSRWDSVAADLEKSYGYPAGKVYNMALGGTSVYRWSKDDYIDAVAALEPSVVVVSGINSLRYAGALDTREDIEAADETVKMIETYIDKLEARLPGVKILVVGGIKTPDDYRREYLADTEISSWERIDLYNAELKRKFSMRADVSYVDIQRYLMMPMITSKGTQTLGFYCSKSKLRDSSSLKSAHKIVCAKVDYDEKLDPYFKADLRHPTALSYSKIWLPHVGAKAVQLAGGSGAAKHSGQVR